MVTSFNSPIRSPEFDFDPLLLDFDPIQEWIVEPDNLLMSSDESKITNSGAFEHKVAGLDAVADSEIGSVLQPEIMYSAAGSEAKGLEFLEFDLKISKLILSVDEKAKDVSFGGKDSVGQVNGGIVNSCVSDIQVRLRSGDYSIAQPNDGVCHGNDSVNVNEGVKTREGDLVGESIKTECESDEESSGSELKELGEDDTSLEDDSSSSSSSDDDEEEDDGDESSDEEDGDDKLHSRTRKQLKVAEDGEIEEGEIMEDGEEEMGNDSDEEVVKGPIRSENESEVLPPVPKVDVSLEPHHRSLPVGAILSILDSRVVVEGSDNHEPLNEGSILWLTESRTPLGFIDEIFGPVKNPYYVVRFNSYKDIPGGISEGSAVSFVQEFASYVLNQKDLLCKKGYDASGDYDEELDDEPEFSDDEKEAKYKQSLRQAKRANKERCQQNSNGLTSKRTNNKHASMNKSLSPSVGIMGVQQQASVPSGLITQPVAAGNFGSFVAENASSSGNAPGPFNFASQVSSCFGNIPQRQLNMPWLNNFPQQNQQHPAIQGLVMNILASQQHQNQFNISNGMPSQQQIWPGGFMTPFVQSAPFGLQPPVSSPFFAGNFGPVPFGSNSMQEQVNSATPAQQIPGLQRPAAVAGRPHPHMQSSQGRPHFRGGRRPHHRGGRHSFGRGGRAGNR